MAQSIFRAARKLVVITFAVLLFSLTSILGPSVQSTRAGAACTVDIIGQDSRMYTGEHVTLTAMVSGGDPLVYSWEIEGDIVKDYDDDVLGGQTANLVDPPTTMDPIDFKNQVISFYWKPESDVNRTVTVRVQAANGVCETSKDFLVMKGDNINTQAEDFYVGTNHPEGISTRVLDQHNTWHRIFNFRNSSYNDNGNLFFDFHKVYIAHFDSWRNEFGYRPIATWDPGTLLPLSVEVNHLERGNAYEPTPLPSWFRIHPNGDGPIDRTLSRIPCETADAPTGQWPLIQDALTDFDTDLDLLGCALTSPFHNTIHVNVGGDMGGTDTAPLDPIFWQWHKYVDGVADTRIDSSSDVSEGQEQDILQKDIDNVSSIETDTIPPRIFYQNPFRLVENITREQLPTIADPEAGLGNESALPAISVFFNEPVLGVMAEDFTINNSSATQVAGEGAGPYVFAGFTLPPSGQVNVKVAPGNIVDGNGNKFEGETWNYRLFVGNDDSDKDGISNAAETSSLTDPGTADTDGDGLSDGFEVNNGCLNPLVADTHVMDIAGNITDEDGPDADSDGISNVEEVKAGNDPCGPLPPEAR